MTRMILSVVTCATLVGCSDVTFQKAQDKSNTNLGAPNIGDNRDEGQPVFEVASGAGVQVGSSDGSIVMNGTLGTPVTTGVFADSASAPATTVSTGFWSLFTSL